MGYRISDLPQITSVQGTFPLEIVDLNEPNLAQRSKRVTVEQLRAFITGGVPIPPPDTEWVQMPTVTNTDFTFSVSAGQASFAGTLVDYTATSYTVPAAASGLKYIFLIYAKPDGTFGTVSSGQSQNPASPPFPSDALYVSHATITETGGAVEDPSTYITEQRVKELLTDYYTKTEVDALIEAIEPGTTSGQATAEAQSALLSFTNPFGHIRTTALSGAQTFTKSGTVLGSTIVQAYTSDGTGTITFDFAFVPLWSAELGFTNGGALPAGDYQVFVTNTGSSTLVNIAPHTPNEGTEPTPNQAPTVASPIADQTQIEGFAPYTIDLAAVFTDADSDSLTYSTDSQDTTVVTASVSGTTLTLTGGGSTGSTIVTVHASDGEEIASTDFVFTVNAAGNTTPAAPTNGVVDDANNTFTFTLAAN